MAALSQKYIGSLESNLRSIGGRAGYRRDVFIGGSVAVGGGSGSAAWWWAVCGGGSGAVVLGAWWARRTRRARVARRARRPPPPPRPPPRAARAPAARLAAPPPPPPDTVWRRVPRRRTTGRQHHHILDYTTLTYPCVLFENYPYYLGLPLWCTVYKWNFGDFRQSIVVYIIYINVALKVTPMNTKRGNKDNKIK